MLVAIKNRVAAALGVAGLAVAVATLQKIDQHIDTSSLRCIGWLILTIAAAAGFAVAGSRKDRNTTAFIALGALCLFTITIFQDLFGSRWLALAAGVASWFASGTSSSLILGFKRRRAHLRPITPIDSLHATYDLLRQLPSALLDRKAESILAALPAGASLETTIGALAQHLDTSLEEIWIISALLDEMGLVRLIGDRSLHATRVARTPCEIRSLEGESAEDDTSFDVHLPPITVIKNTIVEKGGTIVEGDSYKVSGANVTGAFGRNLVRDISSHASGGQAVTVRELIAEARALADHVPTQPGKELRDVSDDLEKTANESELRRRIQRLIGIAALLGSQGQPLVDLARRVIESIAR